MKTGMRKAFNKKINKTHLKNALNKSGNGKRAFP